MQKRLKGRMEKEFRPEFLNRLDEIIVFRSLTKDNLKQIVNMELAKVESNIKDYLIQQALQKQSVDYMAQLKKDAGVEILDERLKPKESSTTPVVPLGQPPLEPTKK